MQLNYKSLCLVGEGSCVARHGGAAVGDETGVHTPQEPGQDRLGHQVGLRKGAGEPSLFSYQDPNCTYIIFLYNYWFNVIQLALSEKVSKCMSILLNSCPRVLGSEPGA